jgi:signal transduction histidine kinase
MNEGVRIVTEDYYPDFDRWYETWSYPFDQGLAVSFFDITQRKNDELRIQAEKRKFEAIFLGSATALVFFRGPDLVYDIFNQQYQELVPGRDLQGKPLLEALPELKDTAFPKHIKHVFETGESIRTYEELAPLVNPKTGEVEDRYFDSAISLVDDGQGKPYGVFVQASEVTERVLARRKIEQALSVRDTFLSIASHELRTPITGMKLQTQLVKRSLAKNDVAVMDMARIRKLVDQTDSGLTRINRLVDDMLDISRIHSGKLALNRELTDFQAIVQEVLERFSDELKEAGITPRMHKVQQPLLVDIDRFRMEQVLTNLVTNAIKYAPGAPITIEHQSTGDIVRMIFRDHGPGIAEKDQERIFERFERLVTPNDISGMGLGLYIVRHIMEAHGGRIFAQADSTPGARFVLELPQSVGLP